MKQWRLNRRPFGDDRRKEDRIEKQEDRGAELLGNDEAGGDWETPWKEWAASRRVGTGSQNELDFRMICMLSSLDGQACA